MSGAPEKIGSCIVQREIGRGGMGVVYLAIDQHLDREVAVKAMPEEVAADPDRLARFQREARLLASLNHANVAGVHGLEEVNGCRYLILEYVQGDDLSSRLLRGPLPIDEAVEIGAQVAAALEAAHDKGVVHRDLKPANIKLTPNGTVKVLDFGLAKSTGEAAASPSTDSPTVVAGASPTMPGIMLGTAGYMSPEQARGRGVDKRSDIFSFGCVLYEMLTGAPTFPGETVTDSVGASLHVEPDWSRLPAYTPGVVRHLLKKCLEKDRRRRLQDIADARVELEDVGLQLASGVIEAPPEPRAGTRQWLMPGVIGTLSVALLAVIVLWRLDVARLTAVPKGPQVTGMQQLTDLPGPQIDPVLSPDGRSMLYLSRDGEDLDIFLQRVGGETPLNLTESFGGDDYQPAFSPDGERIAFHSLREGGGLFIMGATGESPRRLVDTGYDPAWSPDGRQLVYTTELVWNAYGRLSVAELWTVDVETRQTSRLFEGDAVGPAWSPHGDRIAFWSAIDGQRDIWTIDADGGTPVPVTHDVATDWNPIWSPDGRSLMFLSDRSGSQDLWRVAIDEATGEPRGTPQPVTTGVALVSDASMSSDGERVAVTISTTHTDILRLTVDPQTLEPAGEPETLLTSARFMGDMLASPDGQWLTWRTGAPDEDIYVMRTDGTARRRLTEDVWKDRGPRWSPDGRWLAFYSNRSRSYELWVMRPDGTDLRPLTEHSDFDLHAPIWSPDGRRIAVNKASELFTGTVFYELDAPPDAVATPLKTTGPGVEGFIVAGWSPDGRWLVGQQAGPDGVYCLSLYDMESGQARPIRRADGTCHVPSSLRGHGWASGGRYLFWDREREAAYMWHAETAGTRKLEGYPGPGEINITADGRTVYLNRVRSESEVWLLTLDQPANP